MYLYDCILILMVIIFVLCFCVNIKVWFFFVIGGVNDIFFFSLFVVEFLIFFCFFWIFCFFDILCFFFDLECIVCFFFDFL